MCVRIKYECPVCQHKWEEEYECACDGECPCCLTRNIQAVSWEDLPSGTSIELFGALRELVDALGQAGDDFAPQAMAQARRTLARHPELSAHIDSPGEESDVSA